MEVPLLAPTTTQNCGVFCFHHLKTWRNTAEVGGYTAILRYVTMSGINADPDLGPVCSQHLSQAGSKYFADNKRYFCIHFKTTEKNPKQVSVGVHGFFSQMEDPTQLEYLKLRLEVSMIVQRTHWNRSLERYVMLDPVIDLNPPETKVHRNIVHTIEKCVGNEPFFEVVTDDMQQGLTNILDHHDDNSAFLSGIVKVVFFTDKVRINQQSFCDAMKDPTFHSDFAIVGGDGCELPCHKLVLAAHSPVISANLQSGLQESKNGKIHMLEMTQENIGAMLDYLYKRDVTLPMANSRIASELFQAGHKYNIITLESQMRKILLEKPHYWYELEVALDLFLFARQVVGCEDLKRKGAQVMKVRSEEMMRSKCLQDFFKDHHLLAMELFATL